MFSLLKKATTPITSKRTFVGAGQVPSAIQKLGPLNHVAVAVPNIEESKSFYRNVLGANVGESMKLPDHGVTVAFVNLGQTKIELLEPLGENSPIENFLKKNQRGGIHHICIEVDDLDKTVAHLNNNNIKPLADPKIGSHGKRVIFLNPKNCGGVLVELEEEK